VSEWSIPWESGSNVWKPSILVDPGCWSHPWFFSMEICQASAAVPDSGSIASLDWPPARRCWHSPCHAATLDVPSRQRPELPTSKSWANGELTQEVEHIGKHGYDIRTLTMAKFQVSVSTDSAANCWWTHWAPDVSPWPVPRCSVPSSRSRRTSWPPLPRCCGGWWAPKRRAPWRPIATTPVARCHLRLGQPPAKGQICILTKNYAEGDIKTYRYIYLHMCRYSCTITCICIFICMWLYI